MIHQVFTCCQNKLNLKNILFVFCLFLQFELSAQVKAVFEITKESNRLDTPKSWKLVWHDEFDGNQLDVSKWFSYYPYTASGLDTCPACRTLGGDLVLTDSNLVISNGTLKIIGKKQKATWYGKEYPYTSGNLFSTVGFLYGRFEIRCKLPPGLGMWPAFWTLGEGVLEEIDVFEINGRYMRQFQTNYHHCYEAHNNCQDPKWHLSPALHEGFNVFAIEWDPFFIRWYVNNKLVRTMAGYESSLSNRKIKNYKLKPGIYNQVAHFPKTKARIIAGLGIDSPKHGKLLKSKLFPAVFEIDYIRIYETQAKE